MSQLHQPRQTLLAVVFRKKWRNAGANKDRGSKSIVRDRASPIGKLKNIPRNIGKYCANYD